MTEKRYEKKKKNLIKGMSLSFSREVSEAFV